MKIEIKGNDVGYQLHYGDQTLFINDEEVFKGHIKDIIEKITKIIGAWY